MARLPARRRGRRAPGVVTVAAPVPVRSGTASAWVVSVTGVVQGVGFRPFVHRLARRVGVAGYVRNVAGEVEILVEGDATQLREFVHALTTETPPLACITRVETTATNPQGHLDFRVVESRTLPVVRPLISPDVAPCAECERELYDGRSRRAGFPFITCTNCGPRHSVIEDLPYDRERTTMRVFAQCPACAREYEDIEDRRYRSETNSCPECGPSLSLLSHRGELLALGNANAIADAAARLRQGAIVAVRGIGGFHLAVDATNESAVARLRRRKRRDGKPLAVMVRHLDDARALAIVSDVEARLLTSSQRPIVVLASRMASPIANGVSEGLRSIGVMLPCSPLHMLFLDAVERPLVMTSGNPSSLPLATTTAEALATLGDVADAFLTHNREIAMPIDDSVLRVVDGHSVLIRRARGYAPLPITIPIDAPRHVLAVGAELKNTFTLADGGLAFVSHHIGDLDTLETVEHWERGYESLTRMLGIEPRIVARDLHPEYASTRLASRIGRNDLVVVQHHHAHIAAVAAEHGVTGAVIGIAFDGTGLGGDGRIWGGEFLIADLVSFRRVGQLRYAPLPGGDRAAREGWRAAIGYAHLAGDEGEEIVRVLRGVDSRASSLVRQQCAAGVNAPQASSMGRLFDAAAAITGICNRSRYEGEAAMRLEAAAGALEGEVLPFPVIRGERWLLDPVPLLVELARRVKGGEDPMLLAACFHDTVGAATAALAVRLAEEERIDLVALGGGVFQNARLLSSVSARLSRAGLQVLTARALPPNDEAISYGQAAVAAARLVTGS